MGTQQTLSFLTFSLLLLISSVLGRERCHPDDRKALFNIQKAFHSAYIFASWTADSDCCTWSLVKCDEQAPHRITVLTVTGDDKLAGPIPDAVGDLPYLQELTFLLLPNLIGPLPQAISRLKNLNSLSVSDTNITGPVPGFISRLTKLTTINLSVNKLTGLIPPSLSNLPNLGALFLERNMLTGPIPDSFGRFKNNQDFYLRLAKNKLSGPIPKSLGAVNFTELNLSKNHNLTGDAAFLFGANKGLQRVDLSRNQLSFDMTHIGLPTSLNALDLSHNKIFGSLPTALGRLPYLQQFNVSYNRLCGPIPAGEWTRRLDKYSFLHNKCLCGSPLPPCKA